MMTNAETIAERREIPAVALAAAPVAITPGATFQGWVDRINATWDKSVLAILETGRELLAAKKVLGRGEWQALCESGRLRFSRETAFRLMKIAQHPILSNVAHVQHLPPSWGTLYELTKLPDSVLATCVAQGWVTPETTRAEAVVMVAYRRRVQSELPSRRGQRRGPRAHVESLEETAAATRNMMTSLARVLAEPLTFDAQGRIASGVYWLPPIEYTPPIHAKPIKVLHRCECGHVHEDRRTKP